jgi:Na+/H+ antiporter NhaD/arsenite permease-like protein
LLFVLLIVVTAHHSVIFIGVFLFFLGIVTITKEYQDELRLRQSLLVGFFLAGLVVLGGLQSWWLQPLLARLDAFPLFAGTAALTALTDNAALTYLGSQVEGISEAFKYALVAGAVAGGGLTVIANAPNPAGYSILNDRFGPDGIKPLYLFLFALPPTLVAACCLWLLP